MNAADPGQRLPTVATGDELEELNCLQPVAGPPAGIVRAAAAPPATPRTGSLRTPTAMLGQIEISSSRVAEEYRRVLTVLHGPDVNGPDRGDAVVPARADAETKSPSLERLDLRAWLIEHLVSWSGHARAADMCTEIVPDGPLLVRTQAPLLGQLVDNLLEMRASTAAGTPITVSLAEKGDSVFLTVADAGRGIANEDRPHFEPFYRSAEARRQGVPGTGLGLAVAQRIALALGGTLHVHSQPGHGSRFTLEIPTRADRGKPCGQNGGTGEDHHWQVSRHSLTCGWRRGYKGKL